jgi:Zn-dependent M28 family amino/carboxypeptidase
MKADTTRLYNDVDHLSSITPARNYRHPASLEKACAYIENEFTRVGAQPQIQSWTVDGALYKNVIATYNPGKKQKLIVGAHYDVCGDQPGADDNASGVAGMLELTRLVFEQKPLLNYSIEFVAYCLEEPPFFGTTSMGSHVHAKSLHNTGCDVIGMISMEMIGYFSDEPDSQPYPSPQLAKLYPAKANFIIVVGIQQYATFNQKVYALMAAGAQIDVQVIHFPDAEGLAGLSDQRNYWKFDYPALMINDTAFIRNPNYHTKYDTIDTLDFTKMAEVVTCSYKAVTNII